MSAHTLLSRLEKVRKRGNDQWSACCPAHDDRGPSLSVKELSDGRVLIKCFAGCAADVVVDAVGLDLSELFPPSQPAGGGAAPLRRRSLLTPGQALEVIAFECLLTWTAAHNLAAGHSLTPNDLALLSIVAERIRALAAEVHA